MRVYIEKARDYRPGRIRKGGDFVGMRIGELSPQVTVIDVVRDARYCEEHEEERAADGQWS